MSECTINTFRALCSVLGRGLGKFSQNGKKLEKRGQDVKLFHMKYG